MGRGVLALQFRPCNSGHRRNGAHSDIQEKAGRGFFSRRVGAIGTQWGKRPTIFSRAEFHTSGKYLSVIYSALRSDVGGNFRSLWSRRKSSPFERLKGQASRQEKLGWDGSTFSPFRRRGFHCQEKELGCFPRRTGPESMVETEWKSCFHSWPSSITGIAP